MKRFSMGIFVVLGMAALACGGGGSSSSGGGGGGKGCADLAASVNACNVEAGGTADLNIQGYCEAFSCTGSMQTVIDDVIAAPCETKQDVGNSGMVAQGCSLPATCTGIAYQLYSCFGDPVAEVESGCAETTCTGSKTAAIACVLALPCDAPIGQFSDCMTHNGCPDPFSG